jgi:hypothetical protein
MILIYNKMINTPQFYVWVNQNKIRKTTPEENKYNL